MNYQELLDDIAENDRHGFLKGIENNWCNHRGMLLLAMYLTEGLVVELGSGEGSTPFLRQECEATGRDFRSFDNNKEWCDKTGAEYIEDWDGLLTQLSGTKIGLLFIDHAPGERRSGDALYMANEADVLVLHDTEEGGAGDYRWNLLWPAVLHRLNFNRLGGGAGATAVSNTIDLNRFRGLSLGQYTFDDD